MCVSPYIVRDKSGNLVPVPCGKCFECLQAWSKDWRFRLKAEQRHSKASLFLTLTYNDDHLPVAYNDDAGEWQSVLLKEDLQKFFKRMRKNCPALKFRYFAVGEYGGKYNRCHHHVVFFFQDTANLSFREMYNFMRYCWQGRGFIYLKSTTDKQINYVSGYFNKIDKSSHITPPYKLMSKSLGLCWLTERVVDYLFTQFPTAVPAFDSKAFQRIPRYYRKKLDEMTNEVEPDNYGFVWSDIVRMREYKPKGKEVWYKYFCDNYLQIYKETYNRLMRECRINGYHTNYLDTLERPNVLFNIWSRTIPELVNSIHQDYLALDAVKVRHRYTKLNEKKILYG